MSSFTRAAFTPMPRRTEHGRRVYQTEAAITFYVGRPDTGFDIIIPAGFATDLASIPLAVLWLLGPLRRLVEHELAVPAALHDRMRDDLQFCLVDCDALFLVAMQARRVNPVLRELAFLAVRTNRSRAA
ncbi:MAG: DUF1353 domain-containing protein [Caulobacteraceae bacterium]